jgi:hypothetical protein
MICRIDVYALLSANGNGMFVGGLVKQNMLPSPEKFLPPALETPLDTFLPEEQPYFRGVMKLDQEVLLLALQVGQIARDLRAEATQRLFGGPTRMISWPHIYHDPASAYPNTSPLNTSFPKQLKNAVSWLLDVVE